MELCGDGLDNDCDGAVDEDFIDPDGSNDRIDGVGEACAVGRGVCLQEGVFVCEATMRQRTVCSAIAGMLAVEVCDEPHDEMADDDCDGMVDEGCACNPRAPGAGGPPLLNGMVPQGRGYVLPDPRGAAIDPEGLGASCTGQLPGVAPRDEMALVWQPRPGLVRVEVSSDVIDPRAYVAPLCRVGEPAGLMGELACGFDAGLSLAVGDSRDGKGSRTASMVVRVPDPAPAEVGVFVEPTLPGAAAGDYRVEISDPTGVAACRKELVLGQGAQGREASGAALCSKRLTNMLIGPPGAAGFTVVPAAGPLPAPFDGAGRWDDPRFCVDNDGRARSVEVDWGDLVDDDGVEAVMLPAGAERGDWWSTVVPADLDWPSLAAAVEPRGAAAVDAPCLANSVRLLAWLTCTTERAQPMAAVNCTPAGANAVLVCDSGSADVNRFTCAAPGGGGPDLPRRDLNLLNLNDRRCRADGGELVLHIGVIREDDPAPIACGQPGDPCAPATTIPPGACFRYRLRVRRP